MNEKIDFENVNNQPLLLLKCGVDYTIGYKGKFNIRGWDNLNKEFELYAGIFDKAIKDNDELRKLYDEVYGLQLLNELKYTHELVYDEVDEDYRIQDMVKDFDSKYDDDIKSRFIDAIVKSRAGYYTLCKGTILKEHTEECIRLILKDLIEELQADENTNDGDGDDKNIV